MPGVLVFHEVTHVGPPVMAELQYPSRFKKGSHVTPKSPKTGQLWSFMRGASFFRQAPRSVTRHGCPAGLCQDPVLCSMFKRKEAGRGINRVTGSELIIFINNEPMFAFQVS